MRFMRNMITVQSKRRNIKVWCLVQEYFVNCKFDLWAENNTTNDGMGWWKETHFNASDVDGDGLLNLTEFNEYGFCSYQSFFKKIFILTSPIDSLHVPPASYIQQTVPIQRLYIGCVKKRSGATRYRFIFFPANCNPSSCFIINLFVW